jgi:predicted lipoprotein with Yx(FWY)xxD motif
VSQPTTRDARVRARMGAFAGLLAAAALLVACGGSKGGSATPTPAAPSGAASASSTATAAASPAATATATVAVTAPGGSPVVGLATSGTLAPYLVGPNGHALYVYAKDSAGTSTCTAACAQNWPPLLVGATAQPTAATGVTGTLAVIQRGDGTHQVTYNGAPLYEFHGDNTAGDTLGNGVAGLWSVAKPTTTAAAAGAATPAATATKSAGTAGY